MQMQEQFFLNPIKKRFLPPAAQRKKTKEPCLSDFEELSTLGRGGFGTVICGRHKQTRQVYALKKMIKSKINQVILTAIQNEINITSKLDHPNIVKMYDYFEEENEIVLMMEYIDGQQLYQKLFQQPQHKFSEEVSKKVFSDLVEAIEYLHTQEPAIVHRDIKPENLMMTKDNQIKLVDFGWSNYLKSDNEVRQTICGTAVYFSPEMVQQQGNDKMHDIWCIGILLYECLTGRDPFSPDANLYQDRELFKRQLNYNIVNKAPYFPRYFPKIAQDLVIKLLQKKPAERLTIQQVKQHPWMTGTEESQQQQQGIQQQQNIGDMKEMKVLYDEITQLKETNIKLEKEKSHYEQEFQKIKSTLDKFDNRKKEFEMQAKEYEKVIEKKDTVLRGQKNELDNQKAQTYQVEQELLMTKEILNKIQSEFEAYQIKSVTQITKLNQHEISQSQQIQDLQKQCNDYEQQINDFKQSHSEISEKINKIISLQNQVNELTNQKNEFKIKYNQLEEKLQFRDDRIQDQLSQILELKLQKEIQTKNMNSNQNQNDEDPVYVKELKQTTVSLNQKIIELIKIVENDKQKQVFDEYKQKIREQDNSILQVCTDEINKENTSVSIREKFLKEIEQRQMDYSKEKQLFIDKIEQVNKLQNQSNQFIIELKKQVEFDQTMIDDLKRQNINFKQLLLSKTRNSSEQ